MLHLQGVLVVAQGLGETLVDVAALWGLVEDVAKGVDALHEAGADFVGGALLAACPDGAEGECGVEGEAGERCGAGQDGAGGVDQGLELGAGAL